MGDTGLELSVAWQRHVGPDIDRLDGLLARHREKHRRYHTSAHVAWVVRHVDELVGALSSDESTPPNADHGVAIAAAFFHDAIYEPRSPAMANERASARLARRVLAQLGWDADRVEHVGAIIEGTADHAAPTDLTTAVVFDADLAILAAEPAGYSDYVRNTRAEYAHVDDDDWRSGRAQVLQSFLDRPTIFATEPGKARWEEHARANITAELATLSPTG